MRILISDMGGVLYSFDASFDPVKHLEAFDVAMKHLGLENEDIKSKLEGEYLAIQSGELQAYPIETGINNLKKNMETCKVVIISMAPVRNSKLVLERFGVKTEKIDFYNMADFGSKKEVDAWKQIFKKYESIDFLVEDGEANLEAANQAAKELGFEPKIFVSMQLL